MEILNNTIQQVLGTIIIGILSIAGGYAIVYIGKGVDYLKTKTSMIEDEKIKSITNHTLDKVETLIKTNITAIENVSKPIILQAIADKKVDKSELNTLAQEVKTKVLEQMGQDSLDILNGTLGDVDGYITNKIEAVLSDLKIDPTSSVSKTEIK